MFQPNCRLSPGGRVVQTRGRSLSCSARCWNILASSDIPAIRSRPPSHTIFPVLLQSEVTRISRHQAYSRNQPRGVSNPIAYAVHSFSPGITTCTESRSLTPPSSPCVGPASPRYRPTSPPGASPRWFQFATPHTPLHQPLRRPPHPRSTHTSSNSSCATAFASSCLVARYPPLVQPHIALQCRSSWEPRCSEAWPPISHECSAHVIFSHTGGAQKMLTLLA